MHKHTITVLLVAVLAGIGLFFLFPEKTVHEPPQTAIAPPAEPEPPQEQSPQYPPPPQPEEPVPLPALDQSDEPAMAALAAAFGEEPVRRYLLPKNLVRHIVATVDNLPRGKVAMRLRPVGQVPGPFAAGGPEEAMVLDPLNFARYQPLVALIESVDPADQAALYWQYYPLMQQAYEELGYPGKHFNDRVVEVIDHMLAAPEPVGPIALVRPKVFYQFADPALEAASAGHKIMLRVGPENARRVKTWLSALRHELTRGQPGGT